jgi:hypothetical protein
LLIDRGQGADTGCLEQAASNAHSLAANVIQIGDLLGYSVRHDVLFRLRDPHRGGERGTVARR